MTPDTHPPGVHSTPLDPGRNHLDSSHFVVVIRRMTWEAFATSLTRTPSHLQFFGGGEMFPAGKFPCGIDRASAIVLFAPAPDGIEVLSAKADGAKLSLIVATAL